MLILLVYLISFSSCTGISNNTLSPFKVKITRFSDEGYFFKYDGKDQLEVRKGLSASVDQEKDNSGIIKRELIRLSEEQIGNLYNLITKVNSFEDGEFNITDTWTVNIEYETKFSAFILHNAKDKNLNKFIDCVLDLSTIPVVGNEGIEVKKQHLPNLR